MESDIMVANNNMRIFSREKSVKSINIFLKLTFIYPLSFIKNIT